MIRPVDLSFAKLNLSLDTKEPIRKYDKARGPTKFVNRKSSKRPVIIAP